MTKSQKKAKYATREDLEILRAMLDYLRETSVEQAADSGDVPAVFSGQQEHQQYSLAVEKKVMRVTFNAWTDNYHNGNAEDRYTQTARLPERVARHMWEKLYNECREKAKRRILARLIDRELYDLGIPPPPKDPR